MKKTIILFLSLLLVTGCAKKEIPPIEVKPIGKPKPIQRPLTTAFKDGEELTFIIKYFGFLPLGEARAKVKEWDYEGREAYYLTVEMKSSKFCSLFYRVEDYIESYLDARRLRTLHFIEHLREGRHIMEKETTYDQERHIAVFNNKMPKRIRKVMLDPNTQDPVSALYFIRAQEFEAGKTLSCSLNNHKRNYLVEIKILRKEKIKIPPGKFLSWAAEVEFKENRGPRKGKALVWFSADKNKLPLLVKTRSPIGPITAQLLKAKL